MAEFSVGFHPTALGDAVAALAAAVAAQAAVDAVEVKTDKLTAVADGLQLAAGESLLIPDGESVRPVNTEMATIGTTTKQFSVVNTAKTDYTP